MRLQRGLPRGLHGGAKMTGPRPNVSPERNLTYTVALLILAFAFACAANSMGGWAYVLLWFSLSFLLLAAGYAGMGARIFGKRQDGTLPLWSRLIHLGYVLPSWIIWHMMRLLQREAPFNQVSETLYVGRRLLGREFPKGVANCVDLTSEFDEAREIRQKAHYVSLPILDGGVPRREALEETLNALPDGPTFVHCAQGHGRAALFAMALLACRKEIRSYEEGMALLRSARPGVVLNRFQEAFVRRHLEEQLRPAVPTAPNSRD